MFKNVVSLEDLQQLYQRYCSFKESIRNGSLGKTTVFRINYMDIVWLLLTYSRATKENNYDLHLNTLFELCPLFFAYNHQNYSRYNMQCSIFQKPTREPRIFYETMDLVYRDPVYHHQEIQ